MTSIFGHPGNLKDDGVIVSILMSAFALPEAQLLLFNLIVCENALKIQKQFQSHSETISVQQNTVKKFREALFGTDSADKLQKDSQKKTTTTWSSW